VSGRGPADWIHLDVGANGAGKVRRLVEDLAHRTGRQQPARTCEVIGGLEAALQAAQRQDAVMAAIWASSLGDKPIGASVVVAVVPLGNPLALREDGSIDLDQLMPTPSQALRGGEQIVDASVVELPAGPAVRLRKQQIAETLETRDTAVLQMFVPIPGHPGHPGQSDVLVTTFSTPTLEVEDTLVELFDAMACSLRWKT
jgi:hypothetical protein